ncbi:MULTISPECIES: flavin reductase family protein [unclassified Streptomyces]|uniref:flavin reductase family protein n=1 Tax=unclassified Streptomyces TaxID=2593676 RepID=UPI002E2B740F|nr:flavin reductase family protein [Streptomyces sp. NBC_00273]
MQADTQKLNQPGPVDTAMLRRVCGHFVTGVTVITSGSGAQAAGTTVNSFTSVSLDPALVLICLHNDSRLRPIVEGTGAYVVNFLSAQQEVLARKFAAKATASLRDVAHHPSATGTPVLDDALGFLSCRVVSATEVGDHTIFVSEVVDMGLPTRFEQPLVFFRGALRALQEAL